MNRLKALSCASWGQTTAEYALVLVVAATIVGVFIALAKGGALNDLFETIVDNLVERAEI